MRVIVIIAAAVALAACQQQGGDESGANATTAPMNESVRAGAAAGLPHSAVQADAAEGIVKERRDNYKSMSDAMKVVTRELSTGAPNLNAVRQNAATFTDLGPQILTWFPPGSGPGTGKTRAKAEIWQQPEDFAAKALAMSHAAVRFQTAAQGEDLNAIRAAHGDLGKSCKACHDTYRTEE